MTQSRSMSRTEKTLWGLLFAGFCGVVLWAERQQTRADARKYKNLTNEVRLAAISVNNCLTSWYEEGLSVDFYLDIISPDQLAVFTHSLSTALDILSTIHPDDAPARVRDELISLRYRGELVLRLIEPV